MPSADSYRAASACRQKEGETHMESRQIDVSRLAELSALSLLAAKVKLALGRAKRAHAVSDAEAGRIRGAMEYVDGLLGVLKGLRAGASPAAGPDQLYAMDSYMTAQDAWSSVASGPDSDERDLMTVVLTRVKTQLECAVSKRTIEPADVDLADEFFAVLADYASGQHQEILRASLG